MSEFAGSIGRTYNESTPHWPERQGAPKGAPNVVIIYMDDMGYSDPGCYGSEIDTPHIDGIAARGLRLTNYTTHPICSPARAALLTGMNAHSVGTGWIANSDSGFPGYRGEIPLDAPTLAETLRASGYATFMTGKWHNTPNRDTVSAGAKHSWPTQRGFDCFHGFMDGETNFFFPSRLQRDNQLVPIDEFPEGYYATDDWCDQAINYVRDLRGTSANRPFFLYVAHNAVHGPLHSKAEDLAKYRGRYDHGWTKTREARHQRQLEMGLIPEGTRLPKSDPRVPKWDDTDPADRPLFARHMETYAAMLDCVDQTVGRIVSCLEELGELDNTILLFSSDNGGTDAGGPMGMFNNNRRYMGLPPLPMEYDRAHVEELGGPRSNSLYNTAWGEVCNTPFPSFKTYTGAGGRRVSFIVSWPEKLKDHGAIRNQFMHVTDIMPTLLEMIDVPALDTINGKPARSMHGMSMASVLMDDGAVSPRTEQYYECWANRAYQRNGWLARSIQKRGEPIDMDNWTLHHLEEDFSESVDVSDQFPEKLAELVEAFDRAAWENEVYPLDNRDRHERFIDTSAEEDAKADLPHTFWPGAQTTHRAETIPLIHDRSFKLRVQFSHSDGDEGILWAIGDPVGGVVMYVEGGDLHLYYNCFGDETSLPKFDLPAGQHEAVLDYEALGQRRGRGRILVDGEEKVAWSDLSPTLAYGIFEGLDVGLDRRGPVSWELYESHRSFPYTGSIAKVIIEPGAKAS